MTDQDIVNLLSNVIDPESGKDIISQNMVKDIFINKNNVFFTIKLSMQARFLL